LRGIEKGFHRRRGSGEARFGDSIKDDIELFLEHVHDLFSFSLQLLDTVVSDDRRIATYD